MTLPELIKRQLWRIVLCEPEERAELQHPPVEDGTIDWFYENLAYLRRLRRYEFVYGPLKLDKP